MSTALKCPNPSCPYLFDPTRVPAGAVLTCPRCGMRFTLGPPVPPTAPVPGYPPTGTLPPQPPPPGYGPSGSPPAPPPPAGDPAFEGMSPTAATEPQPGGRAAPIRAPSSPVETSLTQTLVLVVMGLALMGGVGVMVYMRLTDKPRRGGGDPAARLDEHNVAFEPPGSPWVQDDDTRVKLGVPIILAFKQPQPEAYMAFGARDYETREPRPSELRAGLMEPLGRLFEAVKTDPPIPDAKWLGRPALAFGFRAQSRDGPNVMGVCYATGYKGIGYWFIGWAGENDAGGQEGAFEATRNKVRLLDRREKWVAQEAPVKPFRGSALGYEVLDGEGIWSAPDETLRPPAEEDPKGDLLLVAKVKQKGRDLPPEATLLVLILDDAGADPLPQGRKYVEEQWTKDVKKGGEQFTPKFTERTGEPDGDPAAGAVEETAPVVRLKGEVPGASSQSRLLVISAAKIDNKVVVVHAWCAWADRELFEARLMQIAGSLRKAD